jgi:hypothetical protein
MAEGKTADPGSRIKLRFRTQKRRSRQKEKKKQKKKNVLKYGKLSEFPTFQHDKQTTNDKSFIFTIITCIVYSMITTIRCIVLTGLTHLGV